jgi:methionyl-tRNA formyltransferase
MKVLFMGTSNFAVPILHQLMKSGRKIVGVVTQPDKPKGRGMKIGPSPVKEAAIELGLPVFQPSETSQETFIKLVKELFPDIIILSAFGQILPKEILEIPKYNCINVHPSLLPKYRGPAPIQWAIINGEKETGVSIFILNERLDAGDIIAQKKVEIKEEDNAETLSIKLSHIGAKLVDEIIDEIKYGNIIRIPQDDKEATYAPSLEKEDGLVDWELPAKKIHNLVRGLYSWPGTYTFLEDKMIKICETAVYEEDSYEMGPKKCGKILTRIKNQGWLVSTGQGKIIIKKIQPEGKKVMSVDEFCCGHHVEIGTILGRRRV